MTTQRTAWTEGYHTALYDFGIYITEEKSKKISPNPHGQGQALGELTEHEKHDIHRALGYHFEDCTEWDEQAEILYIVVMRILARRPGRGA